MKRHLKQTFGVYVESGALDGTTFSNTRIFDDLRCWSGVLIEPSAEAERHAANRPNAHSVHAALVGPDFKGATIKGDFSGSPIGGVSSGGGIEVPARTMADILRELHVTHVDFWSLDIEGYELQALAGVDWEAMHPTFILVEVWHERSDRSIFDFMSAHEYVIEEDLTEWPKTDPREHRDYLFRHEPDAAVRKTWPPHRIGVPATPGAEQCNGASCGVPPLGGWV